MKLRDKFLYMSFGAGLVVLGMVLNSLIDDADAQVDVEDATFRNITCRGLTIKNGSKERGSFGLISGDAILQILGDDEKTLVAYLGANTKENGEMMFRLYSKSKTDEGSVLMKIDKNGGSVGAINNMGKPVVAVGVGSDGSGVVAKADKFGYTKR